MSWRCDLCDSYNDEKLKACYVCGQSRSEASLREARARALEERRLKVDAAVSKYAFNTGKALFIAGTAVSALVVVILLIMKIAGGALDDIFLTGGQVARRFWNNLTDACVTVPGQLFPRVGGVPLENAGKNLHSILQTWEDNTSMEPVLTALAERAAEQLGTLADIAVGLLEKAAQAVMGMIHVIGSLNPGR